MNGCSKIIKVIIVSALITCFFTAYTYYCKYIFQDRHKGYLSNVPHVAVINIFGTIALHSTTDADHIIRALGNAYTDKNTKVIILRIDSIGGSGTQARRVYKWIEKFRKLHPNIPIFSIVEDYCLSASYYIASATTKIFATTPTFVGAIGVIQKSVDFSVLLEKTGISDRSIVAGKHKSFLNPALPLNPKEKNHIQKMLNISHKLFINDVKKGRGSRLKGTDAEIFDGLAWSGSQAKSLGLIDDLKGFFEVLEMVGLSKVVNFTIKKVEQGESSKNPYEADMNLPHPISSFPNIQSLLTLSAH